MLWLLPIIFSNYFYLQYRGYYDKSRSVVQKLLTILPFLEPVGLVLEKLDTVINIELLV